MLYKHIEFISPYELCTFIDYALDAKLRLEELE